MTSPLTCSKVSYMNENAVTAWTAARVAFGAFLQAHADGAPGDVVRSLERAAAQARAAAVFAERGTSWATPLR